MKTITYEDFVSFDPCWLTTATGRKRAKYYAAKKERWSALDILALKRVSVDDRLWLVLRPELIDKSILHEFACWCAEEALKLIDQPDHRSINAIAIKRKWLKGEATDRELAAARDAAGAAARAAAWAAGDAARAAAWAAGDAAGDAAGAAAWAAGDAAGDAARDAARERQVDILISLLEAQK